MDSCLFVYLQVHKIVSNVEFALPQFEAADVVGRRLGHVLLGYGAREVVQEYLVVVAY